MTATPLVLIVDDDPDMLDVEEDALVARGYRVAKASNGEEALARVAEAPPQLILLDMRMPVMDGWTFARAFRERYGRSIPIVVVTAAEDSKLRADEIGAEGELGKPFELDDLYAVVTDIVGGPGAP
jgi:CheY-like chemotaxis protein